jgi:hypothetical protein
MSVVQYTNFLAHMWTVPIIEYQNEYVRDVILRTLTRSKSPLSWKGLLSFVNYLIKAVKNDDTRAIYATPHFRDVLAQATRDDSLKDLALYTMIFTFIARVSGKAQFSFRLFCTEAVRDMFIGASRVVVSESVRKGEVQNALSCVHNALVDNEDGIRMFAASPHLREALILYYLNCTSFTWRTCLVRLVLLFSQYCETREILMVCKDPRFDRHTQTALLSGDSTKTFRFYVDRVSHLKNEATRYLRNKKKRERARAQTTSSPSVDVILDGSDSGVSSSAVSILAPEPEAVLPTVHVTIIPDVSIPIPFPECTVCLSEPCGIVYHGCGHVCVCKTCNEDVGLKNCPICRALISSTVALKASSPTCTHCRREKPEFLNLPCATCFLCIDCIDLPHDTSSPLCSKCLRKPASHLRIFWS